MTILIIIWFIGWLAIIIGITTKEIKSDTPYSDLFPIVGIGIFTGWTWPVVLPLFLFTIGVIKLCERLAGKEVKM